MLRNEYTIESNCSGQYPVGRSDRVGWTVDRTRSNSINHPEKWMSIRGYLWRCISPLSALINLAKRILDEDSLELSRYSDTRHWTSKNILIASFGTEIRKSEFFNPSRYMTIYYNKYAKLITIPYRTIFHLWHVNVQGVPIFSSTLSDAQRLRGG